MLGSLIQDLIVCTLSGTLIAKRTLLSTGVEDCQTPAQGHIQDDSFRRLQQTAKCLLIDDKKFLQLYNAAYRLIKQQAVIELVNQGISSSFNKKQTAFKYQIRILTFGRAKKDTEILEVNTTMDKVRSVLATQSHVVHGYVGNKAATFPLQCLGWDVDCCNSVQFSNHTGYGMDKVFGSATSENDLDEILKGLMKNFPAGYDALLSGYLPNAMSVRRVGENYSRYKKENPGTIWLLDPVMGDEGELYVNEDVVPEYKKLALSEDNLVDIITPNQFEMEILYGQPINSQEELLTALRELHKYIPVIVVTSCNSKLFNDDDSIYCVASMRDSSAYAFRIPLIKSYFTGVGDLFSALLLDRVYKLLDNEDSTTNLTLKDQINSVLNVIQNVLKVTKHMAPKNINSKMGSSIDMKEMELRIIASRDLYDGNAYFDGSIRYEKSDIDYSFLTLRPQYFFKS